MKQRRLAEERRAGMAIGSSSDSVTRGEGKGDGGAMGNEGRKMGIIRVKAWKRNQEVKG